MGQVASHQTSEFSLDGARSKLSCTSPSVDGSTTSSQGSDGEKQGFFLKKHRPDRGQKCLLDHYEVYDELGLQAQEMLKREGLIEDAPEWEITMPPSSNTTQGAFQPFQPPSRPPVQRPRQFGQYHGRQSSGASEVASMAPTSVFSEFTTASVNTRVAGNLEDTSSRRRKAAATKRIRQNYNVVEGLLNGGGRGLSTMVEDSTDDGSSSSSSTAMMAQQTQSEDSTNVDMILDKAMRMREEQAINRKNIEIIEKIQERNAHVAEAPLNSWQKYVGMFGACSSNFKDDVTVRRKQYMSVLHLKTKARLSSYYLHRYLKFFPQSRPSTTADHYAPTVISEDSVPSNGQPSVEYGFLPEYATVNSSVDESVFMDLALTGSLGLVPRKRDLVQDGRRQSPQHYIVLMNRRSGMPLAVCAVKPQNGPPTVRIFSTKERNPGQRAAASTHQLGLDWAQNSLPLYAWAEIVTEGIYPNPISFSVYTVTGPEGRFSRKPNYRASLSASVTGAPVMSVTGRTDQDMMETGCALVSLDDGTSSISDANQHIVDRNGFPTSSEPAQPLSFHIDIAQGIDPGLIICLTAVMDEVVEKAMRLQCGQVEIHRKNQQLLQRQQQQQQQPRRVAPITPPKEARRSHHLR